MLYYFVAGTFWYYRTGWEEYKIDTIVATFKIIIEIAWSPMQTLN